MNDRGAQNTDREIWREREGDYYADSIHVTKGGGIGLNCGGMVYVKPVREWHKSADTIASLTVEVERLRGVIEDAIETLEAMDLHVDNPLYERLCAALQSTEEGE